MIYLFIYLNINFALSSDIYSNIRSFAAECDYSLHCNLIYVLSCKMNPNLGERFLLSDW